MYNIFFNSALHPDDKYIFSYKKLRFNYATDILHSGRTNLLFIELLCELISYYGFTDKPNLILSQDIIDYFDRTKEANIKRDSLNRLVYINDMYSLMYIDVFTKAETCEKLQEDVILRYKNIIYNRYFTQKFQLHIKQLVIPYIDYLTKGVFKKHLSKEQWEDWCETQKCFRVRLQND